MDLLFLTLSLFMSIILTVIINYKTKHSSSPNKLPPGSFGWPLIGEAMQFLYTSPEKFIHDRMNKYSSEVFKTSVFGKQIAVVCSPSGNKFLFSNKDIAAWRMPSMEKLFRGNNNNCKKAARDHEPDPPLITESEDSQIILQLPTFLKPKAIMDYLPVMNSVTKDHLDTHWNPFSCNNVVIKVFPLAKQFTLTLACRLFLGLDDPNRLVKLVREFDAVTEGLGVAAVEIPGTAFYRARKAVEAIRRELRLIVKEKAAAMGMEMETGTEVAPDMLGFMMGLRDGGEKLLREEEIADKMMGLLVAGYSTIASAITFLMKYIGMHSHVYDEVLRGETEQREIMNAREGGKESGMLTWEDIQKMKYSWNVVQEVMRLEPPLQGTFREASADLTFAGFTIPKGWKICWSVSSTNKNPKYFPDPERFDPSRYEGSGPPPYTFVPFGGGARTCPGKEYARTAVLIFLHKVVERFEWDTVFPDEKIISQMMPTPALGLPVRLRSHIIH
ncbi:hypothetical protein Syun_023425 [Stephania yunnanensis]|uniref:Cytochrome P450 n=1 Tax=Stephania yunnanensis TaxID=152371 RepID=A0AAP0I3S9_9MAGN